MSLWLFVLMHFTLEKQIQGFETLQQHGKIFRLVVDGHEVLGGNDGADAIKGD